MSEKFNNRMSSLKEVSEDGKLKYLYSENLKQYTILKNKNHSIWHRLLFLLPKYRDTIFRLNLIKPPFSMGCCGSVYHIEPNKVKTQHYQVANREKILIYR